MKMKAIVLGMVWIVGMLVPQGRAAEAELMGQWRFSESTPDKSFPEVTGVGQAAVYGGDGGAPTCVADKLPGAAKVLMIGKEGKKEWVELRLPSLDAKAFTLELWVKAEPGAAENQVLFGDVSGLMVQYTTGQQISAQMMAGGQWRYTQVGEKVTDGVWTHIAVIYNGEGLSLLQQQDPAVPIAKAPTVAAPQDKPWRFSRTGLGINLYNKSCPFVGSLGAFKLYAGVLSDKAFEESKP